MLPTLTSTPASQPLILAHRGFHETHRENTLKAFDGAASVGADGIEFDVRALGDGTLVVHHDARLRDDSHMPLARLTEANRPRWMPSLRDVAQWWTQHSSSWLDVELKETGLAERALDILAQSAALPRCVMTSFLPEALRECESANQDVPRGILVDRGARNVVATARKARASIVVARRQVVSAARLQTWQRSSLDVWVWDVHARATLERLPRFDYGAVITDRPDRIQRQPREDGARSPSHVRKRAKRSS